MLICASPVFAAALLLPPAAPSNSLSSLQQRVRTSLPHFAMGLFPDAEEEEALGDAAVSSSSFSSAPSPLLTREKMIGFWTIFDDIVAEDSMNDLAAGRKMQSLFSAPIILRADGQTSRGSDFPGGEWSMYEEARESGGVRKRIKIVLRNRRLKQELRYDGLLFALQLAADGEEDAAEEEGGPELRVVGKASRWDVADPSSPKSMGEKTTFSMIKKNLDRTKLTPTIKPFSSAVDPAAVRVQNEWDRLRSQSEEEEMRRAIEDVRKTKAEYGDDWLEADKLVEGRDYWVAGEEPSVLLDDGDGGGGDAS